MTYKISENTVFAHNIVISTEEKSPQNHSIKRLFFIWITELLAGMPSVGMTSLRILEMKKAFYIGKKLLTWLREAFYHGRNPLAVLREAFYQCRNLLAVLREAFDHGRNPLAVLFGAFDHCRSLFVK